MTATPSGEAKGAAGFEPAAPSRVPEVADLRATLHSDGVDPRSPDVLLVDLDLEDGTTGIGFCMVPQSAGGSLGPLLLAVLQQQLRTILLGQPAEPVALWDRMYRDVASRRGARGVLLGCLAAVDLAVWDASGRAAGKPVAALLGTRVRSTVPTYVNLAHLTAPEELAAVAAGLVDAGHRAFKLRGARAVGTPADATRRLRALREAVGPDIRLMVDVNASWDAETAIAMLNEWRDLDLHWLEEPVPPDDLDGYVAVRRAAGPTLIAGGEQHSGVLEFRALLDAGAVDVLQPGTLVVGGLTPWLEVHRLARRAGVPVVPWDLHAVHVHPAAALEGVDEVEYFLPGNDLLRFQHELLTSPFEEIRTDGGIEIATPTAPGIGYVVDRELAARTLVPDP